MSSAEEQELLTLLSAPQSYPEPATRVEHVETHISHVFLTDHFAYKLKKPVRLEFLDFSTPAKRRQACQDELRLNRRFAPGVYLEVVPIVRSASGALRIGGDQPAVDWLVKMRRLPAEASLQALIHDGRLTTEASDRLAAHLARLYATMPAGSVQPAQYQAGVQRHVAANREDLLRLQSLTDQSDKLTIERVHAAQRRWLALFDDVLKRRVGDGRVVDGHGDLRPEHVYLLPDPVIIDCLEFSAELRQVDVADELSFLAIECERLGAPQVGARILDAYRAESGDDPPAALLDFYKSYRGAVRAKVALLRAEQTSGENAAKAASLAREYLDIADRHAAALGRPLLLVVRGLSGTGKSTLAAALAESLALEHRQTDALRRELFGTTQAEAYDEGSYSPQNRKRVYDELFARAKNYLANGLSVVLDGTFLSAEYLEEARRLAAGSSAALLVVECQCSEAVVRQRLDERRKRGGSLSDADYEIYRRQMQALDPIPDQIAHIDLNTTEPLERQLDIVKRRLTPKRR